MIDLGTLPGGTYTFAAGINVGSGDLGGRCCHAFLYSGGVMIDLGTLPGGGTSLANAINNSGQVVGYGDTADLTRVWGCRGTSKSSKADALRRLFFFEEVDSFRQTDRRNLNRSAIGGGLVDEILRRRG